MKLSDLLAQTPKVALSNEVNAAGRDMNPNTNTNTDRGDDRSRCSAPRAVFDLPFVFTAIALSGGWLATYAITAVASKILLAIFGLTYLFGCWQTRRAVLWLLPALYVPYFWLFADWQQWPWNQYRWQWIARLWQLPGFLAEVVLYPLSEPWLQIASSTCTLAIFFTAVLLARPSARAALITSLIVASLSVMNSAMCYALYRA